MYPILNIETYEKIEPLGSKEKFWFNDNTDNITKLFKVGRPGTGENWAEKATSEISKLLLLPCATYEFAKWKDKEGVVTPIFVPDNGRLVHGNELLAKVIPDYPTRGTYKVKEYKLFNVVAIIQGLKDSVFLPIGYEGDDDIKKPLDLFIGYLMFDCWISNPDRHHENWGFVFDSINKKIHLAPTYDHASGLGCRVSDEDRLKRLNSNDQRFGIDSFVGRVKSAFIGKDQNPLKTLDAFIYAAKKNLDAANNWLNKLDNLSFEEIYQIFKKIPQHLITENGINFAIAILEANKKRLLSSREIINNG